MSSFSCLQRCVSGRELNCQIPSQILISGCESLHGTGFQNGYCELKYILYISVNEVLVTQREDVEIDFKKVIGRGSFSQVFAGVFNSKPVAVKKLFTRPPDELLHREIEISKLRHLNIISFYGSFTYEGLVYIVTELAQHSLFDFLHEHPIPDHRRSLHWAKEIAAGVHYLHQNNIIHRDLKSGNVLLMADLTAKVCDFGSAKATDHTTTHQTQKTGTYHWMPPEALEGDVISQSWDVYSYGILLWELWTHKLPFTGIKPLWLPSKIVAGMRPPIPTDCNPGISALMEECWRHDRRSRPTFHAILSRISVIGGFVA